MKKINRKLITIFIILLIVLVILVFMALFFRITDVEVTGNEKYTEDEIEDFIFESSFDSNTFILYFKTKFGEQKDIPFVESYSVKITSVNSVKIVVYEKNIAGYLEYMGGYVYFDKDGMVVETSDEVLENVPFVSGLKFDYVILNEELPVQNEDVFNMLLQVSQMIEKLDISVDKIHVSDDLSVTLSIGDVKVGLGNSDLNEKLSDLSDLYENLEGYSGTLDMTELKDDGSYTMKVDSN